MEQSTQPDVILQHLKRAGHITAIEAIDRYRITRLSSIIMRLKKRGHYIVSIRHDVTDNMGNRNFAEYIYRPWKNAQK